MNQREKDRARWLAALIERLKKCKPGDTYPLDPLERELLLEALNGQYARDGEK